MSFEVKLTAPHIVGDRGEIAISLPSRRSDYADLFAWIRTLERQDEAVHMQAVRTWLAADLYFLGLLSSCGEVMHPYYGRREIDCDFLFEYAREIQLDSNRTIDTGARGHWKCGSVETLVTAPDGSRRRMADVRAGQEVLSQAGDRSLVMARSPIATRDLYRIKTKSGRVVEVTPDHRLLSSLGWEEARNLRAGSFLAAQNGSRVEIEATEGGEAAAYYLGCMVGDGSTTYSETIGMAGKYGPYRMTAKNCSFTNGDPAVRERFSRACSHLGFSAKTSSSSGILVNVSGGARAFNERHGIGGKGSHQKRVPDWVFSSGAAEKWSFLSGYIDCDGYVCSNTGITISSCNRELLGDVQHLFSLLGVASYIQGPYKNSGRGQAVLAVAGGRSVEACQIHLNLSSGSKAVALSALRNSGHGDYLPVDLVARNLSRPMGDSFYRRKNIRLAYSSAAITLEKARRFAEADNNKPLLDLLRRPLHWDRIVSVEETSGEAVDIMVTGDQSFVANGLVSHNSTWKTKLLLLQFMMLNPNLAAAIFAQSAKAGAKHAGRVAGEIVNWPIYCRYFPDVFGVGVDFTSSPKPVGSPRWDYDKGYILPGRTMQNMMPSFCAYSFMDHLPTGGRMTHFFFDDVETEDTGSTDAMKEKAETQFMSALRLQGHNPWISINGTFHFRDGLLKRIAGPPAMPGWKVRNRAAVDRSKPSPEIPAVNPLDGKEVDFRVRTQVLEGAPVLMHPLQLADIRAHHEAFGRLDEYARHYLGDTEVYGERRFSRGLWQEYDDDPRELAREMTIYLCEDPALGKSKKADPHMIWVWGVNEARHYYWLDAVWGRFSPSARMEKTVNLARKWATFGDLHQHRIEEVGLADFAAPTRERYEEEGIQCDVISLSAGPSPDSDGAGKAARAWRLWETPAKEGRLFYPRRGIQCETRLGVVENLVDHWFDKEWCKYPACEEWAGLDAGGLIFRSHKTIPAVRLPVRRRVKLDRGFVPQGQRSWLSA